MRSLYRRLTITHTLVALLAVLLMAALASGLILRAYRQVVNSEANRQARVLAQRLSGPLVQLYVANRGWEGATALIERRFVQQEAFEGRLLVADARGRVVFDSVDELRGMPLPALLRLNAVPMQSRGSTLGYVVVQASAEQRALTDQRFGRSLFVIVLAGSLAALAVALVVALLVARRLVRPLGELTMAARRLAAGVRHQPITPPREAELAELAQAFNSMAAELERQEQLRRQMVADIAHELRTPLSVLRLQVESIEDGIVPSSPQAVGALGGELDLLARLVDDLRLLSLAEAGQLSLALQAVRPADALAGAARAAELRARQQQIDLRVVGGSALPAVRADPQRLAQILANLVENALRYTPRGGTVELSATLAPPPEQQIRGALSTQRFVRLQVRDTGPGIAAEDLPHIFARFYRADRARARETGGSGLGLAIVQRLVQAQGGSVAVESAAGQGAAFQVFLPIA